MQFKFLRQIDHHRIDLLHGGVEQLQKFVDIPPKALQLLVYPMASPTKHKLDLEFQKTDVSESKIVLFDRNSRIFVKIALFNLSFRAKLDGIKTRIQNNDLKLRKILINN